MKKSVSLLLAGAMCAGLLAGCSSSSTSGGTSAVASGSTAPSSVVSGEAGSKSIEKLSIAFVPSREPEEIITATEPLKEMLTAELAGLGYDVGEVEITVGTSYEAVGEALSAGHCRRWPDSGRHLCIVRRWMRRTADSHPRRPVH